MKKAMLWTPKVLELVRTYERNPSPRNLEALDLLMCSVQMDAADSLYNAVVEAAVTERATILSQTERLTKRPLGQRL